MLLDLLAVHPEVSTESKHRPRCYILLRKTVIRNVFTSQYIVISNELKESEI